MKELLPYLPKPSHYLGNEINSVHKKADSVSVRIGLAFPDMYEVGMSYLGQKILYKQLNDQPDFSAERVFSPSIEAAQIIRKNGKTLCTLESDTPLKDLDILAFSLTHELCYTNILYMLDLAQIPFYSRDRRGMWPLVIAGGGAVFNAEPVADFFDLMVLGDGEKSLVYIAEAVRQARASGQSKEDLLFRLKGLSGIYIPSYFSLEGQSGLKAEHEDYQKVFKAVVHDLNDVDFPTDQVLPYGKIVHDRYSVEIARGCSRGCRFCQAGSIYRPVRERKVSRIVDIINQGLKSTGIEELSFLSLSTGDFSALEELFQKSFTRCQSEQVAISLPSLRVGSVNESLMELIARIRRTHATLAPEAGTQRLRDVINKGINEDELLDHTEKLFRLGWSGVKLYFMIGLPTETRVDMDGIRDLCLRVLETGRRAGKRLQVTASISPFIPKSHTPFQWEKQAGIEEIREKIGYLRDLFRKHKKLNLKWHDPEMSLLEGVFARGGRELASVIEKAFYRDQIFTSWTDNFMLEPWLDILEESGLGTSQYLRARQETETLPWDHLDSGVSKKYLLTERTRAFKEKITADCRYQTCRSCGICDKNGSPSRLPDSKSRKIDNILNLDHRDQEDTTCQEQLDQRDLTSKNHHYRIWYEKTGLSIYLSQLELQSIFERAMRRSSWPLTFSKGFRPTPVISFGQALPVGVVSRAEWFNVYVRESMTFDEMVAGLNRNLPSGLRSFKVESLSLGRKQAQAISEEFFIDFNVRDDDLENLKMLWENFIASKEYIVEKQGKKRLTMKDLRPLIADYSWDKNQLQLTLSWENDYLSPVFVIKSIFNDVAPEKFMVIKQRQIMG